MATGPIGGTRRRPAGMLLHNDVRIGASGAERAHPGPSRKRRLPGPQALLEIERAAVKIDLRVRGAAVERRRQLLLLHLEQNLDEPRDARRRYKVSYVSFDRSHRAKSGIPRVAAESPCEPFDFDGVSEARAGPVCFDAADGSRGDPTPFERPDYELLLRGRIGDGVSSGAPAGIHRASPYYAVDVVVVAEGVPERLEQQDAGPFALDEPSLSVPERLAASVAGEHPFFHEPLVPGGVEGEAHASRERHVALFVPQRFDREVDRREGSGAGRIHAETRSMKVQVVGNAIGRVAQVCVREMRIASRGFLRRAPRVAAIAHPGVNSRVAAEPLPRASRVFHRGPANFQENALLRVHEGRLPGRDPEKACIEPVKIAKESAPARPIAAVSARPSAPSAGWRLRNAVLSPYELRPQLVGVAGPRKAARHADHRYGVFGRALGSLRLAGGGSRHGAHSRFAGGCAFACGRRLRPMHFHQSLRQCADALALEKDCPRDRPEALPQRFHYFLVDEGIDAVFFNKIVFLAEVLHSAFELFREDALEAGAHLRLH